MDGEIRETFTDAGVCSEARQSAHLGLRPAIQRCPEDAPGAHYSGRHRIPNRLETKWATLYF